MILLDTHVIVALVAGDRRIGPETNAIVEESRGISGVLISPISFWEVGMLVRKNRLRVGQPLRRWTEQILALPGVTLAEMTSVIAAEAGALPDSIHGDPGDRILIATAHQWNCPLITNDRLILDYASEGLLQAHEAYR